MSYIKISQLPSATGITDDDYLVIVDDPQGAVPVTRKISFSGLTDSVLDDLDTTLIGGSGIFLDYNNASGTLTINAYIDGGNI